VWYWQSLTIPITVEMTWLYKSIFNTLSYPRQWRVSNFLCHA